MIGRESKFSIGFDMQIYMKKIIALFASAILVGCGGGGGNPGTNSSGSGSGPVVTPKPPTISITLVNSAGNEIVDRALSQTGTQFLKIVLKSGTNATAPTEVPVPFEKVTVTLDSPVAILVPAVSSQLTDANGNLLVGIAPASVNSQGAVTVTAAATVGGVAVTGSYLVQAKTGAVGLSGLVASPNTVQKGGSVKVSVNVSVNGTVAPSNSVSVSFNSSCGAVTPASVLVDGAGQATAVVQTTISGACTVTASASGASTNPVPFTVTEPPLTGIQFVSATPQLIYQRGSAGVNTSVVKFKIVDAVGNPIVDGKRVSATLTNTDGGIDFCGAPSSATSGPDGVVSFSVCAGTLPASVQVQASLVDFPSVPATSSNLLTIQTGLPTQRFFDLSSTQLNFYVGGYFTDKFNGNTVGVTAFAADRLGNPVPDGTKIIFVSEGGQFNSVGQSSCLISGGRCTVTFIGQDYRPMGSSAPGGDPRPGRVTILAYADGEEYFIDKPDANGVYNNRYDPGELFEDLGSPFIDKDESTTFQGAYKNLITNTDEGETILPLSAGVAGQSACPANSNVGLSAQGTCNGKWDGFTKVRRSLVIVFSGGEVGLPGGYDPSIPANKRTEVVSATPSSMQFRLADLDGNPLPSDAALSTSILPSGSECKVSGFSGTYGNTIEPRLFGASLDKCKSGDTVTFEVTVQTGAGSKKSGLSISVP